MKVHTSAPNYPICLKINPKLQNRLTLNPKLSKSCKIQLGLSSNQYLVSWTGLNHLTMHPSGLPCESRQEFHITLNQ